MSLYTITKELKNLSTSEFLQLFLDELSVRVVQDKAELEILEPLAEKLQKAMEVKNDN